MAHAAGGRAGGREVNRRVAGLRRGAEGRGRLLGVPEQRVRHVPSRQGFHPRRLARVHADVRHEDAARRVHGHRHGNALFALPRGRGEGRRLPRARAVRPVHGRRVRGSRARVPLPRRERRGLQRHRARLPRLPAGTRRVPSDRRPPEGPAAPRLRRAQPRGAHPPGVEARAEPRAGAGGAQRAAREAGRHVRPREGHRGRMRAAGREGRGVLPRGLELGRTRRRLSADLPRGAAARRRRRS